MSWRNDPLVIAVNAIGITQVTAWGTSYYCLGVLAKPIAVFLLYWTTFVGPDGGVNFRADPYHWDHALTQRIAQVAHGGA